LSAACSVGKWPRALTARRSRELMDSMALVVQMILRISRSKARKAELGEGVEGALLGWGGVDRLEILGDRCPVPPGGVAKRVAQQVHDAGLHDGLVPHGVHRVGQALEAVTAGGPGRSSLTHRRAAGRLSPADSTVGAVCSSGSWVGEVGLVGHGGEGDGDFLEGRFEVGGGGGCRCGLRKARTMP
jgi:hypothetical protein